jgi:hypothetical protein
LLQYPPFLQTLESFAPIAKRVFRRNIRNFSDRFLLAASRTIEPAMSKPIDVALILWNQDVIELMSWVLLHRDLKSSGVEPSAGDERIENFITSVSPTVVVFDLSPPYDRSTQVARRLLTRFPDRSFVMTCADKTMALRIAPWLSHHTVLQKPYEMDEIANTIRLLVSSAGVAEHFLSIRRTTARLAIH